jgi:hypothetical protein
MPVYSGFGGFNTGTKPKLEISNNYKWRTSAVSGGAFIYKDITSSANIKYFILLPYSYVKRTQYLAIAAPAAAPIMPDSTLIRFNLVDVPLIGTKTSISFQDPKGNFLFGDENTNKLNYDNLYDNGQREGSRLRTMGGLTITQPAGLIIRNINGIPFTSAAVSTIPGASVNYYEKT